MHLLRTELNHHEVTVQLSVKIQLLTFLSASCILVGSLCEGFVSVHSASCVLVSTIVVCVKDLCQCTVQVCTWQFSLLYPSPRHKVRVGVRVTVRLGLSHNRMYTLGWFPFV